MKSAFFAFTGAAAILLAGCSLINEDVKDYFKEYTETAAIEKMELDGTYPVNASNITCISSENEKSIKLYLRNPQNYDLTYTYEYTDSDVSSKSKEENYTQTFTKSGDYSVVTLNFKRNFLNAVDAGIVETDGNGNKCISKNISGKINIVEPKSERSFASYPITLSADSVPPEVKNMIFQASSENVYYVCFQLPNVSESGMEVHKADTRTIFINGTKEYFDGGKIYKTCTKNSDLNYTFDDVDSNASSSAPSGLASLPGINVSFDSSSIQGYSVIYYKTNYASDTSDTINFECIVQDDAGLSSTSQISNKAKQLNSPKIGNDISSMASGVTVDDENGVFNLLITHDGLCTDGTSSGTANIFWTVTEKNGKNVFLDGTSNTWSGTSSGNVTIQLPKGVYDVQANASKAFYITSDTYKSSASDFTSGIKVKASSNFYISSSGSDSNSGKKLNPFKTIQKAIDYFQEGVSDGDYESTAECHIYVESDLVDETSNGGANHCMAYFNNSYKYVLEGYPETKRTINANGSESKWITVIKEDAGTNLTLKNLLITGGYINSNATDYKGAGIQNAHADSTLLVENCEISGNKSPVASGMIAMGGGIYNDSPNFTLKNSTVRGNTISGTGSLGAGIYTTRSFTVSGKNTVSGNYFAYNNGSEDVNDQSNLYLYGTDNDVQAKIIVFGDISGSLIYIKNYKVPGTSRESVAFTSGYGYGTTNTSLPGSIFKYDNGECGITYDSTSGSSTLNEAILAKNGGGVDCDYGNVLSISVASPTTSPLTVAKGGSVVFKVLNSSVSPASDVTENCSYTYSLMIQGDTVPDTYYSTNGKTFTFGSGIPSGTYRIFVNVKVNGTTTTGSGEFTCVVSEN